MRYEGFRRPLRADRRKRKDPRETDALAAYSRKAPDEDKLWTVALFSGRRPKRVITATRLREWAAEVAGLLLRLFEECYSICGDLADTTSLVRPPPA